MEQRGTDSGNDFVLDNRKLIIGFLLLFAVSGAFFVLGFMEGKRQGLGNPAQLQRQAAATTSAGDTTAAASPGKTNSSVKDQLEWYKNVQGSETPVRKAEGTKEPAAPATIIETKTAADAMPKPEKTTVGGATKNVSTTLPKSEKAAVPEMPPLVVPPDKGAKVTYSVQVGAFTKRHEADLKAEMVKTRGFACVIEEPRPPDPYYRVKIGKFEMRAEAVAMQRKLTKAGFTCIVKSN